MDKKQKVLLLFLCLTLSFSFSGCKKTQLNDGVAIEFYCLESMGCDQIGDLYYLQGTSYVWEKNSYMPDYIGGTPKAIREQAASHFDTDGHGLYEELGQLDDYYVDESIELYLYTKSLDQSTTVLYFKDGIQQALEVSTANCHRMQYRDGYLYLHPYPQNEEGKKILTIEKIHLDTGETEFITYQLPYYGETTMPTNVFALNRINSDGSLLESHYDLSLISTNSGTGRFLSCIAYPDGRYYEILPEDPQNNKFILAFETEQGYGFLETNERKEDAEVEDFFLKIRYFDREGKELGQEKIDCSKIVARSKKPVHLERSVDYYGGVIYFAVGDFEHFYNYTYDLETKELCEGAKIKGFNCEEYRVVRIENGKVYTFD